MVVTKNLYGGISTAPSGSLYASIIASTLHSSILHKENTVCEHLFACLTLTSSYKFIYLVLWFHLY